MKTVGIIVGSLLVGGTIGAVIYNMMKKKKIADANDNSHITESRESADKSREGSGASGPVFTGPKYQFVGQANVGASGFVSPRFGSGKYVSPHYGASGYTWKSRYSTPVVAGRKLDKSNQEFQDLKKQGLRK